MPERTCLTIGAFDGVHLGHAALLRRARELAGAGGSVTALAFEPHPLAALAPERTPPRLTTWTQREGLLREAGADRVERLTPTEDLLGLAPEDFATWLVETHDPAIVVEGPDFRFGRARRGDVETLERLGRRCGFSVEVVPTVAAALVDQTVAPCSSTNIRWLLEQGRAVDAVRLLGRPHRMSGEVVQGERRGRALGWPTANLSTEVMPPRHGVYAAAATTPDGALLPAALSVGVKPTFEEARYDVEAHLIGWDGTIGGVEAGYGWPLTLDVLAWQREQIRYDTVEELVEQMARDAAQSKAIVHAAFGTARRRPQEVPA